MEFQKHKHTEDFLTSLRKVFSPVSRILVSALPRHSVCVCVCVCVCVRACVCACVRAREREGEREIEQVF